MTHTYTQQNKEEGIVLLEAIIAVGVLVTVFTAAISLYIGSIGGMRMTNDQLIATYLAQDGVEQVIAKRTYNFEKDLDWLDGINCTIGAPCGADYFNNPLNTSLLSNPLQLCSTLVGNCLLYLSAEGVYTHDSSLTASYFTRTVSVTETTADVEARVVVTVSWDDGSDTFTFPLTYILYNNPNNNLTP